MGNLKPKQAEITTVETLRNDIKRVYKEHGKLTKELYIQHGKYSYFAVKNHGGIVKFKDEFTGTITKPNEQQLIDELKRLFSIFKKVTKAIINKHGKWSETMYINHFRSIYKAYEAAGIKLTASQKSTPFKEPLYTKEEVLEDIKRVFKENNKHINKSIYLNLGKYSQNVIYRIFNTWNEAFIEADITPNIILNIPESELLEELSSVFQQHGFISSAIINNDSKFSSEVYQRRFGSLTNAYALAKITIDLDTTNPTSVYYLRMIESILNEPCVYEQTFDFLINPVTGRQLFCDGYYHKYRLCVEYDGPQHDKEFEQYHNKDRTLEYCQQLDKLKTNLLLKHDYKVLRISHKISCNRLDLIHILSNSLL
ncbi:homing endonuclease associated repeat-containing protein [Psychrobacillus sp. FJAT-21963]|uniref:homing endonuclease associated repeat-containing protein n=1 Tax=Psychrobacillus sp. FJAT-21963 TaxID=1712028 RepID=UPI0006F84777|nr:hypothetical protein [Psychrobacillus sp. FJAT-21963]KQL33357.1 hypothetical protein AN959_17515 [Psychrobacillus sp. FJAT-21963]